MRSCRYFSSVHGVSTPQNHTLHCHYCEIFKCSFLRYFTITACHIDHSFIGFLQDTLLGSSVRGRRAGETGSWAGQRPTWGHLLLRKGLELWSGHGTHRDDHCRHQNFAPVMKPCAAHWRLNTSAAEEWICSPNKIVSSVINMYSSCASRSWGWITLSAPRKLCRFLDSITVYRQL
jgi:hypothetical protein